MKIKHIILGMMLAATTLASATMVPALAGDSPKFDSKYSTSEHSESNLDKSHGKRRCFFKKVRIYKHHRYIYVKRKVCVRKFH